MSIFGVYGAQNAASLVYYGLHSLQHRGQEASGIASFDENGKGLRHRGLGLLGEVFNQNILDTLKGSIAMGGVKYANASKGGLDNVPPLFFHHHSGDFAIANDGNLINRDEVVRYLESRGCIFMTDTDSELMAYLIKKEETGEDRIFSIVHALQKMEGGFTFLIMTKNRLYACRDRNGIKPLALGKLSDGYVVSSETCAFDLVGATFLRDVEPGEIVTILEGAFKGSSGPIDEVDPDRGRLKVTVTIFGRPVSVELEYWQVERQQAPAAPGVNG